MSEFIIVTPNEWTELPNATFFIDNFTGEEGMMGMIDRGEFAAMDALLADNGFFTFEPGMGVNNARMLRTGDPVERVKFWILVGPAL